jgi:uncharacterized protein YqeY
MVTQLPHKEYVVGSIPTISTKFNQESKMLVDAIKTARMVAMKLRDVPARTILTTLLGELEGNAKRSGTDITDDMVIQTCKKFVAANLEVIALDNNVEQLTGENVILSGFIPKQLTEEELYVIIAALKPTNLGTVMQHLKANHHGLYNGKLAANVANHIIG